MPTWLKRLWMFCKLAIVLVVVGLLITREYQLPEDFNSAVNRLVANDAFDFMGWEAKTLAAKGAEMLMPAPNYLSEAQRKQLVLDYMKLVQNINKLEVQIDDAYSNPKITNPAAATESDRAQLARLRAEQAQEQNTAETIIEEQVSTVLSQQGFAVGGQVVPPLKLRLTPLPQILIVSPRDDIYQKDGFPLINGLTTDRAEQIEGKVDKQFNMSTLVVPIGGLGIYPTMLLESSSVDWTLEVAAHEWTHNWLELRPLGMDYDKSGAMRTMNETTANLVGQEVSVLVLREFYPELAPKPAPRSTPEPGPMPAPKPDPNAFDFRVEMHTTRVEVDKLLAESRKAKQSGDAETAAVKIDEAEAYMRQRRLFFAEHGYLIRKLNQAYFAFYGAYADQPGAAGADPVGPAVKKLRDRSPSLKAFLDTMAPLTSFEDLQRILAEPALAQ